MKMTVLVDNLELEQWLTLQSAESQKPAIEHIGEPCTWIWHQHRREHFDALASHIEDGEAEQSLGGILTEIHQYGQNYRHVAEFLLQG